jgi:hypothetical protein
MKYAFLVYGVNEKGEEVLPLQIVMAKGSLGANTKAMRLLDESIDPDTVTLFTTCMQLSQQ